MKSVTKTTKINEIYKYIQKLHFLRKSTNNNWNVSKLKKYKLLQKNTLEFITDLKNMQNTIENHKKYFVLAGPPGPA